MNKFSFRILFFALCVALPMMSSYGQGYGYGDGDFPHRKFRVDIGAGYNLGKNVEGFYILLEPKYSISKYFTLGLRGSLGLGATSWDKLNAKLTFSDKSQQDGSTSGGGIGVTVTGLLTGDFYPIARGDFRPYVGLGLGVSDVGSISLSSVKDATSNNYNVPTLNPGASFVVVPRIGIDIWHFRLNVSYTFSIGGRTQFDNLKSISSTTANQLTGVNLTNANYNSLGLEVILFFGGGKK